MAEMPDSFNRLDKNVVMNVTLHLTREFKVRYWIAVWLIRLAAWVLNCDVRVETERIIGKAEQGNV